MNVLVVDDDLESARIYSEMLRYRGHWVCTSHNGFEALELASTQTFDSALVDVILPDTDGFSLAAEISKKQPGIRLLLVSGYFDPEALQAGDLRSLPAHFRTKPLDFGEVEYLLASPPAPVP